MSPSGLPVTYQVRTKVKFLLLFMGHFPLLHIHWTNLNDRLSLLSSSKEYVLVSVSKPEYFPGKF